MAIGFTIEVTEDGQINIVNLNNVRRERRNKGISMVEFPDDYCLIDIETTGLDTMYDSIIEVSALRVRKGIIEAKYSTLVRPTSYHFLDEDESYVDYVVIDGEKICYVDSFISELTGITNKMLEDAPTFEDIHKTLLEFISNDILVGHNVNFDINFLFDNLKKLDIRLSNNFVDTLRLARNFLTGLPNHKLQTLTNYFGIDTTGSHRAEKDCLMTYDVYNNLKSIMIKKYGSLENFHEVYKREHPKNHSESDMIKNIAATKTQFDESHPFFGKEFVFTGKLDRMQRKDAMQLVVDLGGKCGSNVTKLTNFLVLGNNDYCSTIKDGKSTKQKKAEQYKLKGFDIEILSEEVFYDMLED